MDKQQMIALQKRIIEVHDTLSGLVGDIHHSVKQDMGSAASHRLLDVTDFIVAAGGKLAEASIAIRKADEAKI